MLFPHWSTYIVINNGLIAVFTYELSVVKMNIFFFTPDKTEKYIHDRDLDWLKETDGEFKRISLCKCTYVFYSEGIHLKQDLH